MSRRAAYVGLHYGREYLAWAIRSVQRYVDEIHCFYTPSPSHGSETSVACPETEAELRLASARFANQIIHWHVGHWKRENEHRGAAVDFLTQAGFETILVLDADEIWDGPSLEAALDQAEQTGKRDHLAPFVHFWRSFHYTCEDPSRPVRIYRPRHEGLAYLDQKVPVLHFGYAQSEAIMRYKIGIHGHRAEWKPNWLDEKFLAWRPGCDMVDVHPTCGWNTSFNDWFWTPRLAHPEIEAVARALLDDHPYKDLELIQ